MTPQRLLALAFAACLSGAMGTADAHDAISADARAAYLARLDELQRTAASNAAPAARAAALVETGRVLDEIRSLLNEDIISHGKTQGLETSLLVSQLNGSTRKLQLSPQTRLYLADTSYFRDALKLDARGRHAPLARYLLLKDHFYDSFTDNPLKPVNQSPAQLREQIALGEALVAELTAVPVKARKAGSTASGGQTATAPAAGRSAPAAPVSDPTIDSEEVHFILAMHYLQALGNGALPKVRAETRAAELKKVFRSRWPDSLKLATLDALSAP